MSPNVSSPTAPSGALTRRLADRLDADERALIDALDQFTGEVMRVTQTPGLGIAVALGGRLLYESAHGVTDLATGAPLSVDSTWRGGSFAKVYVATAAMQLVEDGLLGLYDPVHPHLDGLELGNPMGERDITLYDLLTHRSGLSTGTAHWRLDPTISLEEHLADTYRRHVGQEYNRDLPLWTAKVGERYQYSSVGVATVGLLIERLNAEGLSFADHVNARIAQPLRLTSTRFRNSSRGAEFPGELSKRSCSGYMRFGQVHVPTPMLYSADSPAADLLTTPGDHARLLLSFLTADGRGPSVLRAQSIAMMTSPQVQVDIPEMPRGVQRSNGIGFELEHEGSYDECFGHGGVQVWGWCSHGAAFPGLDLVVVACSNRWDMTRYYNPPTEIAPGLIMSFIADWVADRRSAGGAQQRRDWSASASYAMGMLAIERVHGFLGVPGALDEGVIRDLAAGARLVGDSEPGVWDSDAFCEGARDMLGAGRDPAAIRSFIQDPSCGVPVSDWPLLGLHWGRKARIQVPMGFFAGLPEDVD